MSIIEKLAIVATSVYLASGCSRTETAVSGPSLCREFSEENLLNLSRQKDLSSVRKLRDLYMICDLTGKYLDQASVWAKTAADLDNEEDKRAYDEFLKATQLPGK